MILIEIGYGLVTDMIRESDTVNWTDLAGARIRNKNDNCNFSGGKE